MKRLRITGSYLPTYWYVDMIGEEFDIISDDESLSYQVYIPNYTGTVYLVDKCDCEVITE